MAKITTKQEEFYIAMKGVRCPHCGKRRVRSGTPEMGDSQDITCKVECLDCKETWTDFYKLTGIVGAGETPSTGMPNCYTAMIMHLRDELGYDFDSNAVDQLQESDTVNGESHADKKDEVFNDAWYKNWAEKLTAQFDWAVNDEDLKAAHAAWWPFPRFRSSASVIEQYQKNAD